MSEFLEILTHARRFKAAVKDLALDELLDLEAKLKKIIDEREVVAAEEQAAMADRVSKIEEIRKQMEEVGLSLDDLGGSAKVATKKRAPRPAKYKIEVDGETITWTGQGRMPKVFKTEVDKGRTMEEFLI